MQLSLSLSKQNDHTTKQKTQHKTLHTMAAAKTMNKNHYMALELTAVYATKGT